ncbi:MAG: RNA polymerase sigma factor [Clostridia bacterium]|nr:RNA polymerase sigma factor [Oscillospiraceae bacterium]MBQ9780316.1 RNA polymerase sigma factor [Clostridia bacterium]
MTDEQIIELYFARQEQAITESARKYGSYCHTIAMNVLDDTSDAEECVNDTWLKAWQEIPPKRPNILRLFFGRITRNAALDKYRRTRAQCRRHYEISLSELEECIPMREEDSGRLTELFNEFFSLLEKEERTLFILRYWHSHSVKGLAKAFRISENAVSLRLMRTREKLRAFLNERGYTL